VSERKSQDRRTYSITLHTTTLPGAVVKYIAPCVQEDTISLVGKMRQNTTTEWIIRKWAVYMSQSKKTRRMRSNESWPSTIPRTPRIDSCFALFFRPFGGSATMKEQKRFACTILQTLTLQ
jgi:hypothetical protein